MTTQKSQPSKPSTQRRLPPPGYSGKDCRLQIRHQRSQATYDDLDPIVMRARNMLKASGADKSTLDNAETYVRKILGRRKSAKPKPAAANPTGGANSPATETAAKHSASQLSFENRADLDAFIAVLAGVADYKPNEADLKVTALRALSSDLKTKNNAASAAFAPLSQARGARDQLLYGKEDSVAGTAQLVKAYVSAAFGTGSQLYKQIKGLKFERSRK